MKGKTTMTEPGNFRIKPAGDYPAAFRNSQQTAG
jgi:hypothetical protein